MSSSQKLRNIVNLNTRMTPSLFDGNNYLDSAYSARMAIGEAKRHGYMDGSIEDHKIRIQNTQTGFLKLC